MRVSKLCNLKFIVTGTGRCGTVYMAKLLSSLNIPCGHESIFDYSDLSSARLRLFIPKKRRLSDVSTRDIKTNVEIEKWVEISQTIAESSYLAAPYLKLPELRNTSIIHIVRNPLEVIRSFALDLNYFKTAKPEKHAGNEKGWEDKIYSVLPKLSGIETPLERACYFYVEWNKLIEENSKGKPYYFSKIEEMPNKEFFEFINQPPTEVNISKQTNSFKKESTISINDLKDFEIFPELQKIGFRYGYDIVNSNS